MSPKNVAISCKKIDIEAPLVAAEILDRCLYTGLFGSIDSMRMSEATETIIDKCETTDAHFIIIDMANVDAIDSAVAQNIVTLANSLGLMGVTSLVCGVRGDLAQVLAQTKVTFGNLQICKNLKTSIQMVLERQNLEIVKKK